MVNALAGLAAVAQTVAQEVFQIRNGVDLLDGGIDVILHAPVTDRLAVEQNVTSAPVAVARLAHRADVAKGFAAVKLIHVINFLGAVEFQRFGENTGDVRVPLETVLIHQG